REMGWSLWSAEGEGRGYAREAARAVIAHAFGPLGWDTAVSYIAPDNARSIALAERLGAIRDDSAAHPGDTPCLVYRHPKPEAA
ncbi:GNAT family N-acetyltransferase, partial [Thioclava sp. BHET1]